MQLGFYFWRIDEAKLQLLKVKIVQSDLTCEQVDAIVNSTNKDLDLTRGSFVFI